MKSSAMEIKQQLSFLEFTSKTRQFGICLFLENAYFFLKATTLTQNPHIYGDDTPVPLVRLLVTILLGSSSLLLEDLEV